MTGWKLYFDRTLVIACIAGVLLAGWYTARAIAKPHTRCQTLARCHHDLAWQKHDRAKLHHQLARRYQTSVETAFQVAEVVYGMPHAEARRVGTCESGLNPLERNSVTATGVMQELDSTFRHTPFGRITIPGLPIASFDAFVNIMAAGYIWHRDGGSWREWVCQP